MVSLCVINALMFVLAIVVAAGKGDKLIAGYNTASDQEKQQFNIKRLRGVLAATVVLSILAVDIPFLIGLEDNATMHVVVAFALVYVCIICVIVANTWCKKK